MKTVMSAFAALAILAAPAVAQTTSRPAGALTSTDAKSFITNTAVSNMFEIESSRLALQKARNPDVKRFAQTMIDDHTKAAQEFTGAVQAANQTMPPEQLDPAHQAIMNRLNGSSDFDREYVGAQTKAHQDAVTMFKTYAAQGDSAPLKQFAAKTLPDLQKHLDTVQKLPRSAAAKPNRTTKAKT